MPIIDTHHHFWKYSKEDYGWITDDKLVIKKDFGPPELQKEMQAAGVTGAISVQARQSLAENDFLLGHAEKNSFLLGVVGWVDLASPNVEKELERYAAHKKFLGVRHVVQDEPDDNFLLRPKFNEGVAKLAKFNLRYDILIFEKHLKPAIAFVDKHPKQRFILDHIAKPKIKDRVLSPWRENMFELAKRPNLYCKLSGMATEADWKRWTPADLAPYFDTAMDAFGPKRLLFGSDWPVLLLAGQYKPWVEIVKKAISRYSKDEQEQILYKNAKDAYGV